MADHHITRRTIMSAIALAPMVIAAPAAAALGQSDFYAKLAVFRAAEMARCAFDENVFAPAHAKFQARCDAIPHITAYWGPANSRASCTTSDPRDVKHALWLVSTKPEPGVSRHLDGAYKEIADGHIAREAEKGRIRAECRLLELIEQSDDLCAKVADAMDDAVTCPVANLKELAAKIEFIGTYELWDMEYAQEAIASDVRRLGAG